MIQCQLFILALQCPTNIKEHYYFLPHISSLVIQVFLSVFAWQGSFSHLSLSGLKKHDDYNYLYFCLKSIPHPHNNFKFPTSSINKSLKPAQIDPYRPKNPRSSYKLICQSKLNRLLLIQILNRVFKIINRSLEMMTTQKISLNRQAQTQWKDELRRGRWKREKLSGPSIFIAKTFEILESGQHSGIVTWSEDGTHFAILDVERFEQEILPAYFRHRNFSSFVRQLNMYDFHKIRNEQNKNIFQHREFRRNSRHLLKNIRRKGCTNKRVNDQQEEEYVYEQESPSERYEEASQKQEVFRPTEATIPHTSQSAITIKPAENPYKTQLIEQFVSTLPRVIESESEIHEIIKKMKKDSKYNCLNSKEDVRKIVHRIRMNRLKRDDEDLDELSIEEEIMVQNVDDREQKFPTLAILTSQNYLPNRTLPLICSLVLCEEDFLRK